MVGILSMVVVTIISRERELGLGAWPRKTTGRLYAIVCPGCEKFTVDNKMLADMTMPSE